MTDTLSKIIAEMRGKARLFGEADENALYGWADRLETLQGEPVAWMHESPERVDVIHAKVKELLKTAGHFHRPLDKTEKYTIPLYSLKGE